MEATNLNIHPPHGLQPAVRVALTIAAAYAALWFLTLQGSLVGFTVPALAPGGRPHPTIHDTLGDAAGIFLTNARVLACPLILAAFGFSTGRRSRLLADGLIAVVLAGNALRVGLALGRDGTPLIPYIPQLPVEWLAAATAGGAWVDTRQGGRKPRRLAAHALLTLVLLAVAAAIETFASPHIS